MRLLNVNLFLLSKRMGQVLPLSCRVIPFGARTACPARDLEQAATAGKSNKKNQPRLHPPSPFTSGVYELHPIFGAISAAGLKERGRAGRRARRGCASPPPPGAPGPTAAKPGAALPSSAARPDCRSPASHGNPAL